MNSSIRIASSLALATAAFASIPVTLLATGAHATAICRRRTRCDDTATATLERTSEPSGGDGTTGGGGSTQEPSGGD